MYRAYRYDSRPTAPREPTEAGSQFPLLSDAMPPRIRSPSLSEEEIDELESPPAARPAKRRAPSSDDELSSLSPSDMEDYDEDQLAEEYAQQPVPSTSKQGGVKIKFKLGGGASAVASSATSSASGRKSKGKGRRRDEGQSPFPASPVLIQPDEDMSDLSGSEAGFSDVSGGSSGSGARLTARQRAKEHGSEGGMEQLQSLPRQCSLIVRAKLTTGHAVKSTSGRPAVKLTEEEAAFKKAEMARKRKNVLDKKLEDEVRQFRCSPRHCSTC